MLRNRLVAVVRAGARELRVDCKTDLDAGRNIVDQ